MVSTRSMPGSLKISDLPSSFYCWTIWVGRIICIWFTWHCFLILICSIALAMESSTMSFISFSFSSLWFFVNCSFKVRLVSVIVPSGCNRQFCILRLRSQRWLSLISPTLFTYFSFPILLFDAPRELIRITGRYLECCLDCAFLNSKFFSKNLEKLAFPGPDFVPVTWSSKSAIF